jgi:hypothetical protein
MMLLLALERLPQRPRAAWIFFGLIMVLVATTTWLFPLNYYRTMHQVPVGSIYGLVPDGGTFTSPSLVACTVLAVRNALYLGIVVWLGVMLLRPAGDLAGMALTGGAKSSSQPAQGSDRANKRKKVRR